MSFTLYLPCVKRFICSVLFQSQNNTSRADIQPTWWIVKKKKKRKKVKLLTCFFPGGLYSLPWEHWEPPTPYSLSSPMETSTTIPWSRAEALILVTVVMGHCPHCTHVLQYSWGHPGLWGGCGYPPLQMKNWKLWRLWQSLFSKSGYYNISSHASSSKILRLSNQDLASISPPLAPGWDCVAISMNRICDFWG